MSYTCPPMNASGLFHTPSCTKLYALATMEVKRTYDTMKKPFLMTILGSALDSSLYPSTPLPSNNFLTPNGLISTHFAKTSTFWGVGERRSPVLLWKVPTLLTFTAAFTAGFSFRCGKPRFCLCNHHVELQKIWGVGKNKKKRRRGGEEVEKHKTTKYLVRFSLLHRESNTK